jgi:hypothetical protein
MRSSAWFMSLGVVFLVLWGLATLGWAEDHGSQGTKPSQPARISSEQPAYPSPVEPTRTVPKEPYKWREVSLYDNYFSPSILVIFAGMTVRWTNQGRHHHTATSGLGLWDSGDLGPGKSYNVTFKKPGVYYYFCRFHDRDMKGVVVVH